MLSPSPFVVGVIGIQLMQRQLLTLTYGVICWSPPSAVGVMCIQFSFSGVSVCLFLCY